MLQQMILNGFAMGAVYALVALGFVLIYKATEVMNFAQGELMMVGAFTAFTCMNVLHLPYSVSLLITLVFMWFFGKLAERIAIRPLVGEHPVSMLMSTIGLMMVVRGLAGMVWGYETHQYDAGIADVPVDIGPVALSSVHLWIFAMTLAMILVIYYFFHKTRVGISMEATSQNQLAAYLMGIGVKKVFSNIWGLSAVIAAVGGILLTPIHFLHYDMGYIGMKAIPAAVLGGLYSVPGAIIGGIVIGVSEALAGVYLPTGFKEVFPYVILIAILLIRPEGIFGLPERKRV